MTQLLVLGMLDIRPMSGYDIQMMLQENDVERWSGVLVGSIYHALKKLEKDKYIEIERMEQTGFRQKAIYKITDKGQSYLQDLIFKTIKTSTIPYPTALYSGLSFIDKLPTEKSREALEQQLQKLFNELESLEIGLEVKKKYLDGELPAMIQLVSNNMIKIVKQQITLVEDILKLFDE
ncbi:PadR family transcriptional regulator [Viridibacillus arvi]|uniref:PadR family transcriptional regulator n=1 Tax=Viridibacillus arvi TaxID=263475 RepID=UPI00187B3E13|nr:PadR family transcriptional regulator [Viridibacillus sp. JNUCC-6]QOV12405.1 PadR family transcriptional regulator [Viridibacillus sp. JNUCC-6]